MTNIPQGLFPTGSLAHLLPRGARLHWDDADCRRLVMVSFLAPPNPGLFGLTPFLSLLGLEPYGIAVVLERLCLESATHRDG